MELIDIRKHTEDQNLLTHRWIRKNKRQNWS